jgi:flavin reductase (DIM6/NTAB) family NADH-FMN oxidoreductase RutF/DNA-binding IclR family transcriptional regulator
MQAIATALPPVLETAPLVAIEPRELRQVLGTFVTGVTVITALDTEGKAHGLTVNSFSSVSLNPPLILWNQSVTAPSHPVFRDAKRFAVNILAEDQIDVSRRFSTPGRDKFEGLEVLPGLGGVPLIPGCAAYLECTSEASFPGGDHMVFIGRVERIEHGLRRSLVFGGGKYLSAQPHELGESSPDLAIASQAHLHAVRVATPLLGELARGLNETLALSVWGNCGPTVIRWEQGRDPMQANLRTGVVSQLLSSATGLAFAAYLPPALTDEMIAAELGGPAAPATLTELDAVLTQVHADGCARVLASDHFIAIYGRSINALCVPVFDMQGRMVLGLTVVGPADTLDLGDGARVPMALRRAADDLSRRLGHPAGASRS